MESQTPPGDETFPPDIEDEIEIEDDEDLTWKEEDKHRAETAKSLAFWLVGLLAGGLLLHYVFICILTGKEAGLEALDNTFNAWLPVISSLLSAAATYYFTRER